MSTKSQVIFEFYPLYEASWYKYLKGLNDSTSMLQYHIL